MPHLCHVIRLFSEPAEQLPELGLDVVRGSLLPVRADGDCLPAAHVHPARAEPQLHLRRHLPQVRMRTLQTTICTLRVAVVCAAPFPHSLRRTEFS